MRVAVQFPVTIPLEMEKPYFLVMVTQPGLLISGIGTPGSRGYRVTKLLNATGFCAKDERDAAKAGLVTKGVYDQWTYSALL